jgi:hypothetical protein
MKKVTKKETVEQYRARIAVSAHAHWSAICWAVFNADLLLSNLAAEAEAHPRADSTLQTIRDSAANVVSGYLRHALLPAITYEKELCAHQIEEQEVAAGQQQ